MADFEMYYNQLNPEQKKAVDAVEGPVMVVAGPGTGKTQILTLRIANILRKTQAEPENILALTFTEAGAKEMRRRLRLIMGGPADRVRLHTYHGFARSIISEFDDHFPHIARAEQLTEIQAETIIREILKDKQFYNLRPAGDPDLFVPKIIGAIGDCKSEAWTPEIVRSFAYDEIKRIQTADEWKSTRGPTKGKVKAEGLKRIEKCERTILFSEIYDRYETAKREQRKIDFDDLIIEVIAKIRQDELLLRLLQEKFQYILIDEHQDTNDAQNLLIRLIAEFFDSPNLFVVGDEKQAIYRFQGASVENFMSFQKKWQGMELIRLKKNYRSHQNILDASFAMIEHNYAPDEYRELRIRLEADRKDTESVDVVVAGNNLAADEYLAAQLQTILHNHPKQTTAIITRRNSDLQRVLSLLDQYEIPAYAERGSDIFADPFGRLFFALIDFLANPAHVESLAQCIGGGLWDFAIDEQIRLVKSLRAGLVADVEKEIPAVAALRKELNHSGAVAYLIMAGDESGLTRIAQHDPVAAQIWRGIISLAGELALANPDNPLELIRSLLEYQTSAGSRTIKISIGAAAAPIRVMTAHGSKGLEFDNVFLPYAVEESWLPRARGEYFVLPRQADEGENILDERRLFYVALTRARSRLIIISPLEDASRQLTPLRFISELDQTKISRTDLPASMKQTVPHGMNRASKRRAEAAELAKKVLYENGLSVTALNHFCDCPSKFFYKSILRLPEAPTLNTEKGNAMHEAMAAVWHLPHKTKDTIGETISRVVKEYFSTSLLPSFEKAPALEALLEDAPIVAAALAAHVRQSGAIATETRRETMFGELLLHGKLDAVIESSTLVSIYDYKTREAMSVNAIKGQTQTDDGNYFRQLVFYKLLVLGDPRAAKKTIEPALVFIKPDAKGRCPIVSLPIETSDIEILKKEVQLLIDTVKSGKLLDSSCDDKDCEFCALRRLM
ncbi:MAG TPA: ATP-dependent DNA helicase [Candidatus Paceibacterota bacterium]|nr:ATP-dependent DNA helicase [Candidatus Paceibacterota bacterium]